MWLDRPLPRVPRKALLLPAPSYSVASASCSNREPKKGVKRKEDQFVDGYSGYGGNMLCR